jgi:predicted membrane protein
MRDQERYQISNNNIYIISETTGESERKVKVKASPWLNLLRAKLWKVWLIK